MVTANLSAEYHYISQEKVGRSSLLARQEEMPRAQPMLVIDDDDGLFYGNLSLMSLCSSAHLGGWLRAARWQAEKCIVDRQPLLVLAASVQFSLLSFASRLPLSAH